MTHALEFKYIIVCFNGPKIKNEWPAYWYFLIYDIKEIVNKWKDKWMKNVFFICGHGKHDSLLSSYDIFLLFYLDNISNIFTAMPQN